MNKQQELEDDNRTYKFFFISMIIALVMFAFLPVKDNASYNMGFQDGQNNCSNPYTEFDNETKIGYTYSPNFNYTSFLASNISYIQPDYSKTGYVKINNSKQERFIYLECQDGTLEITNKTIGCVKK